MRSSKYSLLPQSATGSQRTPLFSCSLALGKHHSQIPQELQRSGYLSLVCTPGLSPLQTGLVDVGQWPATALTQKQPLSLCLSVCLWHKGKRTYRTNWSPLLQCPLGFYMGSLRLTVRHELPPKAESSGEKMKSRKDWKESRATQLPRPQLQFSPAKTPSSNLVHNSNCKRQPDPKRAR